MIQNKKEFSDQIKKRAIFEGFAVSGIASIPGSSRLKLRTQALERWLANNYHSNALVLSFRRELPGIDAIAETAKPSNIALFFILSLNSFLF